MTAAVYTAPATTAMTAFTTLLNGGTLAIYTGTQPLANGAITGTKIVTLALSATAFGAPTTTGSGNSTIISAAANAITAGIATSTNTAAYFALFSSSGSTIATGLCGTSGSDLNLSSANISNGANVSCSSFLVQLPLY
jgi:hypothetical protein